MPIPVQCSGCGVRLNAPDAARGRNVKCPKCQTIIAIPGPAAAPGGFEVVDEPAPRKAAPPKTGAVPPPAKRPPAKPTIEIEDDDDDRPRKRPARVKSEIVIDDEEDRPRKRKYRDDDDDYDDRPRKKGKKKGGGTPAGLIIGLAVAGLLLLGGGGFAVYWFALREKAPDTVAAGTGGGGGGGTGADKAAPPANWVSYSPPTGGFKVYLPSAPKFTPSPPRQPVTTATKLSYSGESEDPMIQCQIEMFYFPPAMSAADKEAYLQEKLDPRKEKVKAAKMENVFKEVSRGDVTLAGVKGSELVFELDLQEMLKDAPPEFRIDKKGRALPPKLLAVARGIVSNDRGYIVVLISSNTHSVHEKAYFDNFELVPEIPSTEPAPKGGPKKK